MFTGDSVRVCVRKANSRLLYFVVCSQIRHQHHGAVENGQEGTELLQEKKTALNPNKAEIPTPNKKKHDYPMVSCFTCK